MSKSPKLTPEGSSLQANTITFVVDDNSIVPILELCANGDIKVHGRLVENDKEVVDALREFLTQLEFIY